ncbi:MAG: Low molecular weight protein tyrosine phosphatase (EC [uncultured Thiotrichaceae bacterium]|uniref:protein-tyrosine-phosphatase n=1 Tax=uncultured Thiotrichaceae bacterium TaxID=298394 RepID=A0A6S6TED4_9GAMM|nr:MAG: Low molecular weight protein tyrosine phosphatase (EC [uncultured Thiotrichaceae bacterium]
MSESIFFEIFRHASLENYATIRASFIDSDININVMNTVKVLFVCMGNICRSPTAEGVFQQLVVTRKLQSHIRMDSAGTHAYHIGEQPDQRSQAAAKNRGIDISHQKARKVEVSDFDRFDYILSMDKSNHRDLHALASPEQRQRIHLFMDFSTDWNVDEVPDPYYGGGHGFERVLDMVQSASEGLLEDILRRHL